MTINNQFKQNKSLFLVSLLSVILMLTGLIYGFNVTQMLTTQKENQQLKREIQILKSKLNENCRNDSGNNNYCIQTLHNF